jgi:2-polyprenyl-3-methyl-5-hydroxy-6-metoxy-1,4-benzoquinol methylase
MFNLARWPTQSVNIFDDYPHMNKSSSYSLPAKCYQKNTGLVSTRSCCTEKMEKRCASMQSSAEIDFSRRISPRELPELMDGDCSYEDFRDCLRSLGHVNRWLLGYRSTLAWLDRMAPVQPGPVHIVDVGSGGGDLLRQIAGWARKRSIAVELTGIDLNPYAARAAKESTPKELNIAWVTGDALAYQPDKPIDIAVSSLMAHHLEDDEIISLLRWMEATARLGWFINDLERSERSSQMFSWLAKLARWHRFVHHDGPVSFRRALREADWVGLLAAAEIPQAAVTVEQWRPGRLCLGRRK